MAPLEGTLHLLAGSRSHIDPLVEVVREVVATSTRRFQKFKKWPPRQSYLTFLTRTTTTRGQWRSTRELSKRNVKRSATEPNRKEI